MEPTSSSLFLDENLHRTDRFLYEGQEYAKLLYDLLTAPSMLTTPLFLAKIDSTIVGGMVISALFVTVLTPLTVAIGIVGVVGFVAKVVVVDVAKYLIALRELEACELHQIMQEIEDPVPTDANYRLPKEAIRPEEVEDGTCYKPYFVIKASDVWENFSSSYTVNRDNIDEKAQYLLARKKKINRAFILESDLNIIMACFIMMIPIPGSSLIGLACIEDVKAQRMRMYPDDDGPGVSMNEFTKVQFHLEKCEEVAAEVKKNCRSHRNRTKHEKS